MFDVERPAVAARAFVVAVGAKGAGGDAQKRLQLASGEEELAETSELVRALGAEVCGSYQCTWQRTDAKTFLTRGKVDELKRQLAELSDAEVTVVLNIDPSPSQQRNLERELERRVLTRTELILAIFSRRAQTHEGKLQVELARLTHLSTRLIRGWTHLDRIRGGLGMRGGAGETQLEMDQRLIAERIKQTRARLDRVQQRRAEGRKARLRRDVQTVALIGYTNAGKSTLFNRLAHADVRAEDLLFATLDPTLRRVKVAGLGDLVLADTVGFIRRLPHRLVDAFKATLEEVTNADLLLQVVDASDREWQDRVASVEHVLAEIDAAEIPRLLVLNKIDRVDPSERVDIGQAFEQMTQWPRFWVSAVEGHGCDELLAAMAAALAPGAVQDVRLAPGDGKARAWLFAQGAVISEEHCADGHAQLRVRLSSEQSVRLERIRAPRVRAR